MTDSAAIIDDILQASTHYDVLGVDSMDSDTAALRKAYLRRSVKVHPDKNEDPRAKEAFQKVAQAWQVLSDDASRAQYDQALKRGRADMNDDYDRAAGDGDDDGVPRRPETYYAGPPPSMQESLFLFATVVGNMMGGKTVANVTEAVYWAEKALSRSHDRGVDGPPSSTRDRATMAMTFGSGLRVASDAARGMGFRESAAKMERTARLAQMAGVGITVAEQPAVRRVLQQGTESLRKFKGHIDAVRTVLNQQQQQQQQQESRHQQQQQQQQPY